MQQRVGVTDIVFWHESEGVVCVVGDYVVAGPDEVEVEVEEEEEEVEEERKEQERKQSDANKNTEKHQNLVLNGVFHTVRLNKAII